eukprot:SAG11_NODE_1313_length_5225_cov_4.247171_3_plen_57_part_00
MNLSGSMPETEQLPGTHVTHGLSAGLSATVARSASSSAALITILIFGFTIDPVRIY